MNDQTVLRRLAGRYPLKIVRPIFSMGRTYARRRRIWRDISAHISGASESDQLVLYRAIRSAWKDAARGLSTWRDPVVDRDLRVYVKNVGMFHVRGKSDDLYHVLPTREKIVYSTILSLLQLDDVFIDAGANVGFYTVSAAHRVGANGYVYAVEMMPDTASVLEKNVRENGLNNVQIINYALSDRFGGQVAVERSDGQFGQARIGPVDSTGAARALETRRLDDVIDCGRAIKLLKLDIEGAEALALAGASEVLRNTRHVIFESHTNVSQISQILIDAGFFISRLDGANSLASKPQTHETHAA